MLEETLAEARDNAVYATPDEHVQLAVPDGVAAVPVDLWDDGLASVPTTEKVALALALEARARGADPRIRQVDHADYGDAAVEVALVSTTGIRSSSRKTSGYLSVGVIAGEGDASQTGSGFSVDRGFAGLDPDKAMSDAVTRAVRMLGAVKGPSGRSTVVFDRRVATTLLSVVSSALSGEAVAKGRSFFAGRIGELVGGGPDPGRRPHRSSGVRRRGLRRRGTGLPAERPHRRGRAARLPLRHGVGVEGRRVLDRIGRAGWLLGDARPGLPGPRRWPPARRATTRTGCWPRWVTACSCSP